MEDFTKETIEQYEKLIEDFRLQNEVIINDKSLTKATKDKRLKSNLIVMLAYQRAVDEMKY
jgi:hypothetical protein